MNVRFAENILGSSASAGHRHPPALRQLRRLQHADQHDGHRPGAERGDALPPARAAPAHLQREGRVAETGISCGAIAAEAQAFAAI